jgi:xanthine dehydrogenase accessory factor
MVVRPDGAFHGTIGGGRLEWEALAAARAALSAGRGPARFLDQALGPDLGQCCGGHVRLLVETFGREDLAEVEALAGLEAEGPFEARCALDAGGRVVRAAGAPVSSPRGRGEGSGCGPAAGASPKGEGEGVFQDGVTPETPPHLRAAALASAPGKGGFGPLPARGERRSTAWTESYGEDRTDLLLFGAGHVGRALVLALAPLPFRVRWIDTRPDAFPGAVPPNAVPVRADAPEAEIAAAPAGALILVMTHDHPLDLAITAAALARPDLPFVGLIGSATKRARFERRFRELGLAAERVAGLACPIGLPGIAGKEPAVIAAATAAQLLAERERTIARNGGTAFIRRTG